MGPAPYVAEQTCKLIIEVICLELCFSERCIGTSSDLSYVKQATKMCNLSYNIAAK